MNTVDYHKFAEQIRKTAKEFLRCPARCYQQRQDDDVHERTKDDDSHFLLGVEESGLVVEVDAIR